MNKLENKLGEFVKDAFVNEDGIIYKEFNLQECGVIDILVVEQYKGAISIKSGYTSEKNEKVRENNINSIHTYVHQLKEIVSLIKDYKR